MTRCFHRFNHRLRTYLDTWFGPELVAILALRALEPLRPFETGLRAITFTAIRPVLRTLATNRTLAALLTVVVLATISTELAAIQYSSSITVGLGYGRDVRQSLPPGFGFLVPRSEGKRLLATTFVHNKFPHRAPGDRALLRCFFAGRNAEDVWALSDEQIVGIVRNELQQILGPQITGLRDEPLFARVYRWKSAMAQYGVGHLDRLERIERLRQKLPGAALAGNAYRGIGVPDCVRSGRDAAKQLVAM